MTINNADNKALEPIVIKGSKLNVERNIFVLKQHFNEWNKLKEGYTGNYYRTTIVRAIYSLASLAGGRILELKSLKLKGAKINYQLLEDGDVVICYLLFVIWILMTT